MSKRRVFLTAGLAWEIIRFTWFFFLMVGFYVQMWVGSDRLAPWLLALSAGGLVLPAGYVMLLVRPRRYAPTVNLLRVGKALQILPVIVILIMGSVEAAGAPVDWGAGAFLYTSIGVAILDFLFLGLLLSFKEDTLAALEQRTSQALGQRTAGTPNAADD